MEVLISSFALNYVLIKNKSFIIFAIFTIADKIRTKNIQKMLITLFYILMFRKFELI